MPCCLSAVPACRGSRRRSREIFGREPERGINPDEVVAVGAAIQASVLSGEVKDVLLLDVTPLSVGIEVAGGLMEVIIPRNTTIPCRKSKVFTTARDNQDMVRVHIVQGEREMVDDNKSLGKLEMHGLPPAPRGIPEIEVTFEIDANGIMHVRAKDLGTGKAQSMRIVSSSGLGDDEIQDMIKNAEVYRAEDKLRREVAEAKNHFDGLIYNTARSVEEFGDVLDPAAKLTLSGAMDRAESALESNDLQAITDAHEDLFTVPRNSRMPSTVDSATMWRTWISTTSKTSPTMNSTTTSTSTAARCSSGKQASGGLGRRPARRTLVPPRLLRGPGVARDATPDELKKAFRALALQFHPDRNPDDPDAELRFREIAEAYGVLSTPSSACATTALGHSSDQMDVPQARRTCPRCSGPPSPVSSSGRSNPDGATTSGTPSPSVLSRSPAAPRRRSPSSGGAAARGVRAAVPSRTAVSSTVSPVEAPDGPPPGDSSAPTAHDAMARASGS